jgi:hypothetical protein
VKALERFGIPGSHVKVCLREIPRDAWGMRGAFAASEPDLGYEVNVQGLAHGCLRLRCGDCSHDTLRRQSHPRPMRNTLWRHGTVRARACAEPEPRA